MEEEFNLYKTIIKAVDEQIESRVPPVTRETFERLVAAGYEPATAKEMIASVMAEEIYFMMTDDRKINEEMFAKKLSTLK